MLRDYQSEFASAAEAAEYSETVSGWIRMQIKRQRNGRYKLTLEWEDNNGEKTDKAQKIRD